MESGHLDPELVELDLSEVQVASELDVIPRGPPSPGRDPEREPTSEPTQEVPEPLQVLRIVVPGPKYGAPDRDDDRPYRGGRARRHPLEAGTRQLRGVGARAPG